MKMIHDEAPENESELRDLEQSNVANYFCFSLKSKCITEDPYNPKYLLVYSVFSC